jgi:PAS domain S-box-containing protein
MAGMSLEDALGTGWQKALHPDDREIVFDEWSRSLGENSPFQAEYRFLRGDGVETWVMGQAEAEIGEDGEIKGYVGTVTDITKIKEAREKILQAKEEAESANRAKSEFLSTVSHELRSPLNAVIGFSDLLLRDEGVKDELTLRLVPKIQESGKQLLAMIEELLDHDRIEQGKVKLNLVSFSINNLIAGTVDSWQSRLPGGLSMSCDLDATCGPVECDSTRITQILSNLIDNALKYSPEGGAIHITTLATPEEVRVSIRDEGLGMSLEEMSKVFDRFQQLESGSSHRAGGLGIGLSLARKLMEMHGGRIWVESEKGEGSTFTFALPRVAAAETQSPVQSGGKEAEEPLHQGDPWTGRTILIVDDLDHYHEYMKLMMRSAGRLAFASNGLEAIETARRENPDLILMDLRMPVMNGFEAIERLKFDPATRDIPIVAVTAQAMEEDRARSSLAGANGFVSKPIDMETLKNEIGRVLGVHV